MKKIIFMLAFMLITTISFANKRVEKQKPLVVKEFVNTKSADCVIWIHTSCGGDYFYHDSNCDKTQEQIFDLMERIDNLDCRPHKTFRF